MNLLEPERSDAMLDTAEDVMFSLLAVAGALESRLESALGPVELSMPKLCLLTQIVQAGGSAALSELAAGLRCVRSNVTQLMDRLEADGLVRRVNDSKDRRVVRAELTDRGVERQAAGERALERIQAEFSARLTPEDREALSRALGILL